MKKQGSGLLRGSHLVAEVLAEELGEAVGAVAGQYFDLPAELVAAEERRLLLGVQEVLKSRRLDSYSRHDEDLENFSLDQGLMVFPWEK